MQANDGYCLDGNRLRLQSGTYGAGSSVYFAEIADFSRITANGSVGYGPSSWTVERKNGLTYTYGGTSDSRVLASDGYTSSVNKWMVSEITDRAGNKVRFTYKTADATTTGITHPTKIEWTQTSAGSGSYVYSMDFHYDAGGNSAASTYAGYVLDSETKDTDLLNSITISVSGTVKKNYVLTYDSSSTTGGKRLTQVQECSDSPPTDCLAATTITYQNGLSGIDTGSTALYLTGNITDVNTDFDFDGNGIKDVAYLLSGTWRIRMASHSGTYGSEINTGLTSLRAGKIRGTNADQLLGVVSGTWYVYTWNGTSFSSASTGITTAASSTDVTVSDVDGDGRDDLVYVVSTGSTYDVWPNVPFPYATIAWRQSTSSASSLSFSSASSSGDGVWELPDGYDPSVMDSMDSWWLSGVTYTVSRGADVDGDGRAEMNVHVEFTYCGSYYGCLPTMTENRIGYAYYSYISSSAGWAGGYPNVDVKTIDADFNHDGCKDFLSGGVALSGCFIGSIGGGVSLPHAYVGAADINGDGIKDAIIVDGSTYHAIPIEANGAGTEIDTGVSASGCEFIATDSNGDGLDEIGCLIPGSSLTIYYHYGTVTGSDAPVADLVSQIQDGFGVTYNPTYATLGSTSYTAYTNATYPDRDLTGTSTIVSRVTQSDGIGGTYYTDYTYYGGSTNLQGKGFQGFDVIDAVDSRSGETYERWFGVHWPYYGRLTTERWKTLGAGFWYLTKSYSYSSATLDATSHNERYFIYPSQNTETNLLVGTYKSTSVSYNSTDQNYGDPTTVTSTSGVNGDPSSNWTTVTDYTYAANTATWCIGLPESISVEHDAPSLTSITQSKSLTNDYSNCRVSAEDVEPGNTYRRVQTSYGYDSFGNVNSTSVTGRDSSGSAMTARTSSASFGTTGQFNVSETNALSQTTTRTFDTTFGALLTETDPNSIVVATNTYDSFGRVSRATRADGTSTVYTYAACATYGCQNGDPATGSGLDRTIVVTSERDTSDAQIRDTWTHYDQFDRPIVQNTRELSGAYNRIGRVYDALGHLSKESVPCDGSGCTPVGWTVNAYDTYGRFDSQTRPRSDTDSTPVTTYVSPGLSETITDANGKTSTRVTDPQGRLRESWDNDSYGQYFTYDAAGSLTVVTDSLSNTLFTATYSYGIQAFQDTSTDMDLGDRYYTHDSLGELVSMDDTGHAHTMSQTFDALSRVTSRTEAEGTTYFTYGTSAGSHNIGQLASTSMTGSSYSEALSYDSVGRLSTRSITADSSTYNIDLSYNTQGQLDTLTYPTSTSSTRVKVKYGYVYGLLESATDWTTGSAGTVYWTADSQNPRGQTTQETLGNGVVTARDFDAVSGWLNSIHSGVSGGTGLQNQSYLYDDVGNVLQREEGNLNLAENFCYDNLYRLLHTEVGTSPSSTCSSPSLSLTYDAMGDITSRSDVNSGLTWSYDPTHKHRVTGTGSGGATYSYDANGNMTSRAGATLTWASYNYPTSLATASESADFYYGPDRQYYRQDYSGPSGSATTYYIGGLLEKVNDGTTTDWRHYILAGGEVVAIVSRKSSSVNAVHYALEDHQGSNSVLTDSSGTNLVRQSYDAFGKLRDGSSWSGAVSSGDHATIDGVTQRGYTGQLMLENMNLIHMNGRVLDTELGRFLSADPYVQAPTFTQSFNRYSYVFNNPLRYIDPSGFIGCWLSPDWGTVIGDCGNQPPEAPEVGVPGFRIPCAPWQIPSGDGGCVDVNLNGVMPDDPGSSTDGGTTSAAGTPSQKTNPATGSNSQTSAPQPQKQLPTTMCPVNTPGVVLSPFGVREAPLAGASTRHNGIDLRNRLGQPVFSSEGGQVLSISSGGNGGNSIIVLNDDGSVSGYAHTGAVYGLRVGMSVNPGQPIGYSDGSGHITGPHLHYTYRPRQDAARIDPLIQLGNVCITGGTR